MSLSWRGIPRGLRPQCLVMAHLVGVSATAQAAISTPGDPRPSTDSTLATLLRNGLAWLHTSPSLGGGHGSLGPLLRGYLGK